MGASAPKSPGSRANALVRRAVRALVRRVPALRRMSASRQAAAKRAAWRARVARVVLDERAVVFESYVGSSYACSPKAIYRAMLRDPRFDGWSFVWAFKDPAAYAADPDFARATIVRHGSDEYFDAYARSKYWVCNTAVQAEVTPRPEQFYLQTWHGTPLKRFGLDIVPPGMTDPRVIAERNDRWRASAHKFSALLAQSPFAAEKLASALGVEGAAAPDVFLQVGYPRNDALATATPADIDAIRARIAIPAGKKVVLYAPTWRDDQRTKGVGLTLELGLDFERLRERFGDDHVVLFRAHFMIAQEFDFAAQDGFVIDVSAVDDVNDLYLVADVLVTDYSSVFFDYANLERPVVFFMYDLDAYSSGRGGFYLGLDQLPGPVVRTQDELEAALAGAGVEDGAAAQRLRAFRRAFAPLDDGAASERVIEHVFGPKES